jgi:hypothetical protein
MCDDNDNGFFQFFAGSLNLQPEKAAEFLLRFARKRRDVLHQNRFTGQLG